MHDFQAMIKKRTKPDRFRIREKHVDFEEIDAQQENEKDLSLADLVERRKWRRSRQGIDADKLVKGNVKKGPESDEEEQTGLGKRSSAREDEDDNTETQARKVVRTNNFTQQTNALDVDKHMMAYIEENLKVRSRPRDGESAGRPIDPQEDLYRIADRWKVDKTKPAVGDEGSVTNSMSMLTAIPEVDLGMDTRLRNIEETEKAKRVVAEERQDRRKSSSKEGQFVDSRFYPHNPNAKSDADILRDAKLEAMGFPPQADHPRQSNQDRVQMATDELVMERFKKRMRK